MDPGSRASRLAGTTILNGAALMPVRAFVFDAYGTLFDVHAAIARHREAAGPDADRLSEIWRTKQLEYAWMLSAAGHYVDFWTLTERALDYAFARVPAVDRKLRTTLLDAYFKLDAFPDARAALKALKVSGLKTAILSNGNPRMLQGAVDAAGLKDDLDAVLSVDSIRIYKPQPSVYAMVTDAFAIQPPEIAFVSSNRWDVMGATAFGFRCVWVNRANLPDEYPEFAPVEVVRDLSALATLTL
jgi:2-haloacid dehalogenase